MIREALAYIRTTFLSTTVRKRSDRAEADRVENYPFSAIEEALVNAVYHRGYDVREPIEVSITPDELTIVSYPGPDRSVKQQELAAGRAISRRYRNRRIGEFLKELDLTEGRGTGVPKILRAMRENGSPTPQFLFDEDHTYFATVLPVHPEARAATPHMHASLDGNLDGSLDGAGTIQVAETVARLVESLDGEMTRQDLQEALGLGNRAHFRKTYLLPALEAGLVEMTHPGKPNSPIQRYRLTDAGNHLRARLREGGGTPS